MGWTKSFAVISPFGLGILGIPDSLMDIVRHLAVIMRNGLIRQRSPKTFR